MSLRGVAARYGLAGIANTIVGFGVIAALEFGAGMQPGVANAIGFATGLAFSFLLNRGFVFRSAGRQGTALRFLAAFAVAFAVNQLMLAGLSGLAAPLPLWRWLVQAAAVGSYTLTMFALCHLWVYRAA